VGLVNPYFVQNGVASWNPSPGDNEVRSLQKIAGLCAQWASNSGVTPSIPWLGGANPSPHDVETLSLQKITASLKAISKT
jgi:hypothetical protein